ncbi:MAG: hypothetical protein ACR2P4_04010 [Gammaproteobacteria bacterium]
MNRTPFAGLLYRAAFAAIVWEIPAFAGMTRGGGNDDIGVS